VSFQIKVCLGVALLVGVALAAFFLLSGGGEEAAIEELFLGAADAAGRGESDGVVAIVSRDYRAGGLDYEGIVRKIRANVGPDHRYGRVEVGSAIHVRGEEADADVRVRVGLGRNAQEALFRVRLRKEAAGWRVVSAEER